MPGTQSKALKTASIGVSTNPRIAEPILLKTPISPSDWNTETSPCQRFAIPPKSLLIKSKRGCSFALRDSTQPATVAPIIAKNPVTFSQIVPKNPPIASITAINALVIFSQIPAKNPVIPSPIITKKSETFSQRLIKKPAIPSPTIAKNELKLSHKLPKKEVMLSQIPAKNAPIFSIICATNSSIAAALSPNKNFITA